MKKKPLAYVSERGSLSESQWRTEKKEEKKGWRCVPEQGEGESTSQSNGGEGVSQSVVRKGGGGVVVMGRRGRTT